MKNLYKQIISSVLVISISLGIFIPVQRTEAFMISDTDSGSKVVKGIVKGVLTGYLYCWGMSTLMPLISQLLGFGDIFDSQDELSVPTNAKGHKGISKNDETKDCGLDFVASDVKNMLLNELMNSAVKWVQGDAATGQRPKFMLNTNQFLHKYVNEEIAYVFDATNSASLCQNFSLDVKSAISSEFYGPNGIGQTIDPTPRIPECTLEDADGGIENVSSNLGKYYSGSGVFDSDKYWDDFVDANTNKANNAFDTYASMSNDINKIVSEKNAAKLADVNRGEGFMSLEKCDEKSVDGMEVKTNCIYTTPGKVISHEINEDLGIERENIQQADEFDEILMVLLNDIMKNVFNGDDGLLGANSIEKFEDPLPKIQEEQLKVTKETAQKQVQNQKNTPEELTNMKNSYNQAEQKINTYIQRAQALLSSYSYNNYGGYNNNYSVKADLESKVKLANMDLEHIIQPGKKAVEDATTASGSSELENQINSATDTGEVNNIIATSNQQNLNYDFIMNQNTGLINQYDKQLADLDNISWEGWQGENGSEH